MERRLRHSAGIWLPWVLGHRITVTGGAYIWLCLLILTLPVNWVIAAIVAGLCHELSHLFALYMLGIPVYAMEIGGRGAKLETGAMEEWEELICAIAGPAGSLFLLLVSLWLPRIALCGLFQGLYNLIPLGNLDGGRVIRCVIAIAGGKKPCKQGKERVQ